jgi:hypothetical protein
MTLHRARSLSLLVAFLSLVACSESTDGSGGAGGSSGDGGSSSESTADVGTGTDAATTSAATTSTNATTTSSATTSTSSGSASVVVNEIDPDADWVELFNPGTDAFDLSGLTLADEDMPGTPKLAEAIVFPAGTTLAAGAYLFVLAKQDAVVMPGEQVPQTACDPGTSPCFYAPFGLSGTNGDGVYLLDGDATITSAAFGAAAVPVGSTWCRDAGGNYAVCATPTPGAANP